MQETSWVSGRIAALVAAGFVSVSMALPSPLSAGFEVTLEPVASGLDSPTSLTHAGDERIFVTERPGRILLLREGEPPEVFLDIRSRVRSGNERGLLSVAFHPAFAGNGFLYVNYTRQPDGATVISRYGLSSDPDRGDPASEAILLVIDQPYPNHNGGQLQFAPDGYLYVGMGDGGNANDPQCSAQRPESLLGKMLRLDVDQNVSSAPFYGIPPGNPFVGPGDPPDEVWSLGLRNPWRFSFDRQTGELFLGDVGQNSVEEIDLEPPAAAGRNYGWKVWEGDLCLGSLGGCPGSVGGCGDPSYVQPILTYEHGGGRCSVTGGYVYRGQRIPDLAGRYLYGDFCSGQIWAARRSGSTWIPEELPLNASQLSSFGEDRDGEIYVIELSGEVSRLASTTEPQPGSVQLTAATYSASEKDGAVAVAARRSGSSDGAVTVTLETIAESAEDGLDFIPLSTVLSWDDGDLGQRSQQVELVDDALIESDETFRVELSQPTGGVALGGRQAATVTVVDDDRLTAPCVAGEGVLCLNGGRFEVTVTWEDFEQGQGSGQAVVLTADSGYFWFFGDDNVEMVVKVLDACSVFNNFWVFAAGLTNVEVNLTVRDTAAGVIRSYQNPLGLPFKPIQDVTAFDC